MRDLVGYNDLPEEISHQIEKVVDIWKKYVNDELVGVYLHGSIVLNAFNPESGDIDILVVVNKSLDIPTKLAIAKEIIEIDKKPCPLEMSAILLNDAKEWKTPGNCVFHYSDFWTEKYREKLKNRDAECYVVDNEFPDADVTSYIKLIGQSGIVLYGKEISGVFGEISDEDFWAAISADIDDYDFHAYDPRYLWMIENVPEELSYLPKLAMKIWYEGEQHELPESDLNKLSTYLIEEIKR